MPNSNLKDKVALVTGSNRGIGLATARELAGCGAKVALNARGKERLESARKELAAEGFDVISIPADVSSAEECEKMIEKTINEFGQLDILVNNAGISMRSTLEDFDAESCKKIVDINLLGCIYPTLFAIPQIKDNKGSIVYISSIAGGIIGVPTASLYCATKKGLVGLADSVRCELAPEGVHVGIVYVGFTENAPDKTVIGAGAEEVPPERAAHMTQIEVAKQIVRLIQARKKRAVLTPVGKFVNFAAWLSPDLVEKTIIFGKKSNLGERIGMR